MVHAIDALTTLAWVYENKNNDKRALNYLDKAIEISEQRRNKFLTTEMIFNKAQLLSRMGQHKEGLLLVQAGLKGCNSFLGFEKEAILEHGFLSKSHIFRAMGVTDSARYYYRHYDSIRAFHFQEFEKMSETESIYEDDAFRQKTEKLNSKLNLLTKRLSILGRQIIFKSDEVTVLESQIQKFHRDSIALRHELSLYKDSIEMAKDSLRKIKIEIKEANARYNILWKNVLSWGGVILFIFGVGFVVYDYHNREKSKKRHSEFQYSKKKLSLLTQAKVHNIKGNYTTLSDMVTQEEVEDAQTYMDAYSFYLSKTPNDEAMQEWTLENERELLFAFYDAERILGVEVAISHNLDTIDKENILFLSDVFTTLLHNSMEHAFGVNADNRFQIHVELANNYMAFNVSDNGTKTAGIEKYYSNNDPERGLNILRRRIINECQNAKISKTENEIFEIDNSASGTLITFIYPYAVKS